MSVLVNLKVLGLRSFALKLDQAIADDRLQVGRRPAGQGRPVRQLAGKNNGPVGRVVALEELLRAHAGAPLEDGEARGEEEAAVRVVPQYHLGADDKIRVITFGSTATATDSCPAP